MEDPIMLFVSLIGLYWMICIPVWVRDGTLGVMLGKPRKSSSLNYPNVWLWWGLCYSLFVQISYLHLEEMI